MPDSMGKVKPHKKKGQFKKGRVELQSRQNDSFHLTLFESVLSVRSACSSERHFNTVTCSKQTFLHKKKEQLKMSLQEVRSQ